MPASPSPDQPLALGSQTRPRVARPTPTAFQIEPNDVDLASMTTAERVERVLIPQHAALRSAGAVLRSAANQLAGLHPGGVPILARVATVIDELVRSLDEHFDHEERALFPSITAARTPPYVIETIHDHHEHVAARLRWLQLLVADVRAAVGITHETMVLFAGVATLSRLFHRHRALEQWVVLAPSEAPAAQPAVAAAR